MLVHGRPLLAAPRYCAPASPVLRLALAPSAALAGRRMRGGAGSRALVDDLHTGASLVSQPPAAVGQ